MDYQIKPHLVSLNDAEVQDEQEADGLEHRLQDVAAARSAMADELAAGPSGLNEDETAQEDDLFTVHASGLGADATASAAPAGEASAVAPAEHALSASGGSAFKCLE